MKLISITVLVGALAFVPVSIAATENVVALRAERYPVTNLSRAALKAYVKVRRRLGATAAGRNIVLDGVRFKWHSLDGAQKHWASRRATFAEVRSFKRALKKLLAPPPSFMTITASPPTVPPAGVMSAVPMAALPACTWQPESGGSYTVVNSSSGARGKYQIMPSTHDAVCTGLTWSPGDQERCAAIIWAKQGASAWVNC